MPDKNRCKYALFLFFVVLIACNQTDSVPPVIVKLGTIDCDLVETSPVVFKGKLYRFEYVRERYEQNNSGDSYFRFIDNESGTSTPAFARGYHLGSAYVENDTAYVTAVNIWDGERIEMFASPDLIHWKAWTVLII